MIRKIVAGIYVVVFFIAVIAGICSRQTYTDITKEENVMDYFKVAVLDTELATETVKRMEEVLPDANIILKVRAEGKVKHMFKLNKQLVTIEEVYKGENINKGNKIYITSFNWRFFFDNMFANMGFVNLLEKDKEYLVFIDEKVMSLDKRDNNTYRLIDTIVSPVFNLEDREHTIVEVNGEDFYVPYTEVSKNEFFVSSQKTLDELHNLKHKLIEKYVK